MIRKSGTFLLLVFLSLPSAAFFSSCSSSPSVSAEEAAQAWYNLGNAYTELNRPDDAVKAYLKARQLDPGLMQAGFNLARILIIQKKYDASLVQLDALLDADPSNRLVIETKAWVFHLKGEDPAALELYNSVLEKYGDSRNSLYNSALILETQENNAAALERFKELYELYPDESSVVFRIARLEALGGGADEALSWLEIRLTVQPDDYEALELAGDMYSMKKQYADAVLAYRKITKTDPDTEASAGNGDRKDAEQPVSGPGPEVKSRIYLKTAEILLLYIEDYDEGMKALKLGAAAGPDNPSITEKILSITDADWYGEAESLLSEAEKKSPETNEDVPEE